MADLDDDEAAPGAETDAALGRPSAARTGRKIADVLLGAETLAVTALALELMSGLVTGLMISSVFSPDQGGSQVIEPFGKGLSLFAVPAAVLSGIGLIRLRADAPAWARAVTGAAVIVAAILLAVIGYAVWHAAGLEPQGLDQPTG